jgi:hypothetical protein
VYEIPKPELLNPDRVTRDDREDFTGEDHRSQAQLLAKALGDSCAYADQLWEQVNALRAYLLESLPPDPNAPGAVTTGVAASPTGPDDEEGWSRWMAAFASTSSVLCGARGDSGLGMSQAREEAQKRRAVPTPSAPKEPVEPVAVPAAAGTDEVTDVREPEQPSRSRGGDAVAIAKAATATIVGVLALRGLRTSPRKRVK